MIELAALTGGILGVFVGAFLGSKDYRRALDRTVFMTIVIFSAYLGRYLS